MWHWLVNLLSSARRVRTKYIYMLLYIFIFIYMCIMPFQIRYKSQCSLRLWYLSSYSVGMLKLQSASWFLLLLLAMADAQQCSWQYNLQTNQPINITSSNFPSALPAGSNCRYLLKAPPNHVIQVNCRFEVVRFFKEYLLGLELFYTGLISVSRHLSVQNSVHLAWRRYSISGCGAILSHGPTESHLQLPKPCLGLPVEQRFHTATSQAKLPSGGTSSSLRLRLVTADAHHERRWGNQTRVPLNSGSSWR